MALLPVPGSLDGFAEKFRAAGYEVHTPGLRYHDRQSRRRGLGTDQPDRLCRRSGSISGRAGRAAHSGRPFAWAACWRRCWRRGATSAPLMLLAPSAPWGVPPITLFEIASAQAMLLNVGFWNTVLKPDRAYRRPPCAGPAAAGRARRGARALCAGIGPRHFRDHALGPGHGPRQRSGCRARSPVRCWCWRAARTASIRPARWSASPRFTADARHLRKNSRHEPLAGGRAGLGKSRGPRAAGWLKI